MGRGGGRRPRPASGARRFGPPGRAVGRGHAAAAPAARGTGATRGRTVRAGGELPRARRRRARPGGGDACSRRGPAPRQRRGVA